MTAIIGSNGAGKSTVIKAAAGLLRVWSGRVLASGTDVTREARAPPARARDRLRAAGPHRHPGNERAGQPGARRPHPGRRPGPDRPRRSTGWSAIFPILGERLTAACRHDERAASSRCWRSPVRSSRTQPPIILDEPSLGLSPKLVDVVFDKLVANCASSGLTDRHGRAEGVPGAGGRALRGYVMHTGPGRLPGRGGIGLLGQRQRQAPLPGRGARGAEAARRRPPTPERTAARALAP